MKISVLTAFLGVIWGLVASTAVGGTATQPSEVWIRPTGLADAMPVWGVKDGIAVGLAPMPGPRGLIRIYTPYLGQPAGRVMNFIAIEPVVNGTRDLSELQKSHLDGNPGLKMWSADAVDLGRLPEEGPPARGVVSGDGSTLSVYVCVEPYANGAHVAVQITFARDRPHEFRLRTFAAADSKPMEACVLTATMGNFARLRHLQMRDQTIEAAELFRGEKVNSWGFFDWHDWGAGQLREIDGRWGVSATGDIEAVTPGDVPMGWRYAGKPALQVWSVEEKILGTKIRVNGREVFWATKAPVPGGAAFENFEIYQPFVQGQGEWFGVEAVN